MSALDLATVVGMLKQAQLDLLSYRVARHLVGRSVSVEWERPYIKGLWGVVHRNGDRHIIKVDPSLSDRNKLKVLLHEIAHCKLHGDRIASSDNHTLPPASYKIVDRAAMRRAEGSIEFEADKLTARWVGFAEERAPGGDLLEKLNTLLDWKDG